MGHIGHYGEYTGNAKHSRKSDERYDANQAYNKNLTAKARLHYLENNRADHGSDINYGTPLKNSGLGPKTAGSGLYLTACKYTNK